jgi:hypothetical protein
MHEAYWFTLSFYMRDCEQYNGEVEVLPNWNHSCFHKKLKKI